eukprot:390273-Pelagomonas_calceolata.AAC.6
MLFDVSCLQHPGSFSACYLCQTIDSRSQVATTHMYADWPTTALYIQMPLYSTWPACSHFYTEQAAPAKESISMFMRQTVLLVQQME